MIKKKEVTTAELLQDEKIPEYIKKVLRMKPPKPPEPEPQPEATRPAPVDNGELKPGEDFVLRGDIRPTLEKHGWRFIRIGSKGEQIFYRPGKSAGEPSANVLQGIFYCFSTSVTNLPVGKGVSIFELFARLEYGGDFKRAASALRKQGFGGGRRAKATNDGQDVQADEGYADDDDPFHSYEQAKGNGAESQPNAEPRRPDPTTILEDDWPAPLGEAAFYGLAGRVVHELQPYTESDPVALLIQFLTATGNAVNRTAHFMAGEDRHFTNLFCVLVGETSKGRKGTSWSFVQKLFALDNAWLKRITGGLSSAEGLIYAVRDPVYKINKKTGRQECEDEGVEDKRLMDLEPEFSSVLKQGERSGNTLSATLRQAWETGRLSTLVKCSPNKCTDGHISIIGNVSRPELRRYLTSSEVAGGLGNRFLWLCVKRAQLLPEGGRPPADVMCELQREVKRVVENVRLTGVAEYRRDEAARELWYAEYARLSADVPGMLGAMTARSEPQTMRVALLYALLDGSREIRLPHLQAALEVWRYCFDSVRSIFGNAIGDPIADEILDALQRTPEGMTKTRIFELFGRNKGRSELDRALSTLFRAKRVTFETETPNGRSVEMWRAI
jgi:hypothetical protein